MFIASGIARLKDDDPHKCWAHTGYTVNVQPLQFYIPPLHQHLSGFKMPCSCPAGHPSPTSISDHVRRNNSASVLTLLRGPGGITQHAICFLLQNGQLPLEECRSRRRGMGSSLRERAACVLDGQRRVCTCVLRVSRLGTSAGWSHHSV